MTEPTKTVSQLVEQYEDVLDALPSADDDAMFQMRVGDFNTLVRAIDGSGNAGIAAQLRDIQAAWNDYSALLGRLYGDTDPVVAAFSECGADLGGFIVRLVANEH